MNEYLVPGIVQLIFTIAHVASKWQDARQTDSGLGLIEYVKIHAPAKTLISLLTSAGLAFVLIDQGVYVVETAFTAGWSSNSLMDHLNKRSKQMLGAS